MWQEIEFWLNYVQFEFRSLEHQVAKEEQEWSPGGDDLQWASVKAFIAGIHQLLVLMLRPCAEVSADELRLPILQLLKI